MKREKILEVLELIAKNGQMSLKQISDMTSISRSSVSRLVDSLLTYDILSEFTGKDKRYFSLIDEAYHFVFDITNTDMELYVISCGYSIKYTLNFSYRPHLLPYDNLSLFFRECYKLADKHRLICASLSIIIPDDTHVSISDIFKNKVLIGDICGHYFKGYDVKVKRFSHYIENYNFPVSDSAPNTLAVTAQNGRVFASYGNKPLSIIRNTATDAILRYGTLSQAAGNIATALGNTVELLGIRSIVFDKCDIFADRVFIPYFKDALSKFIDRDISNDIQIDTVNMPMAILSAARQAIHSYFTELLNIAERNEENEFLSPKAHPRD